MTNSTNPLTNENDNSVSYRIIAQVVFPHQTLQAGVDVSDSEYAREATVEAMIAATTQYIRDNVTFIEMTPTDAS